MIVCEDIYITQTYTHGCICYILKVILFGGKMEKINYEPS